MVNLTTLKLKAKEGVTGEGYITINPASTYTDSQGRSYAFTQSTGGTSSLVQPDMNSDGEIALNDLSITAQNNGINTTSTPGADRFDIDGSGIKIQWGRF